jgi:hypothetical protein
MHVRMLKNIALLFLLFVIDCIITGFLFSGCINWAHVVEHNELRTLEENK